MPNKMWTFTPNHYQPSTFENRLSDWTPEGYTQKLLRNSGVGLARRRGRTPAATTHLPGLRDPGRCLPTRCPLLRQTSSGSSTTNLQNL